MLAAATVVVMVVGQNILGIIPIMVVGSLIFFLGFDLLREALWHPLGKVSRLEYLTVSLQLCFICLRAKIITFGRFSSLWSLWVSGISFMVS